MKGATGKDTIEIMNEVPPNYGRLVLGCIDADFCNQKIIIMIHFSAFLEIYTLFIPLHRSVLKMLGKTRQIFQNMFLIFLAKFQDT
jgi:hypothetical protein